jgi:uncharacterized protein (TIGR02246 family)
MKVLSGLLIASVLCVTASPASATPEDEVRAVITTWTQAYSDGDHSRVAQLYDRFGRVRGVDTTDLIGPESISEYHYFDHWHHKLRSVTIGTSTCQTFDDATATCNGIMSYNLTTRTGEMRSQQSQFGFALAYSAAEGRWLIQDHHEVREAVVALSPADVIQTGAVKKPPNVAPASVVTVPAK